MRMKTKSKDLCRIIYADCRFQNFDCKLLYDGFVSLCGGAMSSVQLSPSLPIPPFNFPFPFSFSHQQILIDQIHLGKFPQRVRVQVDFLRRSQTRIATNSYCVLSFLYKLYTTSLSLFSLSLSLSLSLPINHPSDDRDSAGVIWAFLRGLSTRLLTKVCPLRDCVRCLIFQCTLMYVWFFRSISIHSKGMIHHCTHVCTYTRACIPFIFRALHIPMNTFIQNI